MMLPLFALLLLLWAVEPVESQGCRPWHPQQHFCNGDFVVKAKVTGKQEMDNGQFTKLIKYSIEPIEMFKGPSKESMRTVYAKQLVRNTYPDLNVGTEYLMIGYGYVGLHKINSCNFVKPWNDLSDNQKKSLKDRYKKGCECKIAICFPPRCRAYDPAPCWWTASSYKELATNDQAVKGACLKNKAGVCAWDIKV